MLHVPGPRHTAEAVTDSLMAALAVLPAQLRRSLTWDQGKEMAVSRRHHPGARHAGLLLRPALALAAADEREHLLVEDERRRGFFDGRCSGPGPLGDSENTCGEAFR